MTIHADSCSGALHACAGTRSMAPRCSTEEGGPAADRRGGGAGDLTSPAGECAGEMRSLVSDLERAASYYVRPSAISDRSSQRGISRARPFVSTRRNHSRSPGGGGGRPPASYPIL